MTRWSYLVEQMDCWNVDRRLNTLGEQGWELVMMSWSSGNWNAVLKRSSIGDVLR